MSLELKDGSLFRQQCYIDGQWVDADDGATIAVNNPADDSILGSIPKLGTDETRRAIEAADKAWPAWRAKTGKERSVILKRWYELMLENADDLALLMTSEQGKPLAEAKGEVVYAASFIEWFAEEAKRVYGDTIPGHQGDKRIVVLKQPIGVVAAITPWNFPAAMITRKCAPAMAVGCPVVIKPATMTPYSALALAELAERAGVPKGVINVVTGSASAIGGELTSNPIVRKLSFTGSTEIGKLLMEQCAGTVKKVSLELGGNAPFLVFDDADLDAAVEGAMMSKFRNTGQTCVCANRILVQDGVYEAFCREAGRQRSRTLKVGNGLEEGVNQGPLIDMNGASEGGGARGRRPGEGRHRGPWAASPPRALVRTFYQPTVLTGVTTDMKVTREETFGPVAPLFRFTSDEEGIAMANDTEFGLASYFYARDLGRVWRVSRGPGKRHRRRQHRASSPPRSRPSAASRNPVLAARARSTASTTSWRSSTSAWAASDRSGRGATRVAAGGLFSCLEEAGIAEEQP